MKKSKNSVMKKIGKRILQIAYLILKPFLPFIMLFLFIFFFIILIIDAIFVEFSDDNGELTVSEQEIESYCDEASQEYEVYVDGEISNENIEISTSETSKAITPEQIYSLLIFHNITQDEPISKETVSEITNNFKSKYYYKTSKILTERKVTADEGNITWEIVSEEQIKLITESITIAGHYKYNYELETKEERRY